MSNKLEQLEFKLEKIIDIQKQAGKVRKNMSIWLAFFYQYLAQKIIFDNIAKNEKFQHLKMYPNKISSKRTTATAWFYIIICFA